jgi:hypothetical protein
LQAALRGAGRRQCRHPHQRGDLRLKRLAAGWPELSPT